MREDIYIFPYKEFENEPFYFQMTGVSYCDDTYEIFRRNAELYCIEYVLEGKGIVYENNTKFEAEKGDVYFLKKGCRHHYYCERNGNWKKIWFNMNGRLIHSLIKTYELEDIVLIKNLNLSEYFFKVMEGAKTKPINYKEFFEESSVIFHEMCLKMYNSRFGHEKENSLAFNIKRYLEESTEYHVNINELSKKFFCSNSQINRVFKNEFYVTPYDYLINLRIEGSKDLLKNTNLRVKDIARRLQFADEHYFSSFFKKKIGLTPSEYRRKGYQEGI